MAGKDYLPAIAGNTAGIKNNTMSNITQVVNVDKNLKTLKKGVHASDLDQLLSSTGPFTFFAPSDTAFEKLDTGAMEKLLEPQNRAKMADLINNHIVAGKFAFDALKDGETLTTVNGKALQVHIKDGTTSVGSCIIHARDAKISNGVMHLADSVML